MADRDPGQYLTAVGEAPGLNPLTAPSHHPARPVSLSNGTFSTPGIVTCKKFPYKLNSLPVTTLQLLTPILKQQ